MFRLGLWFLGSLFLAADFEGGSLVDQVRHPRAIHRLRWRQRVGLHLTLDLLSQVKAVLGAFLLVLIRIVDGEERG